MNEYGKTEGCATGKCKHNKGVTCDVRNCVYNDDARYCTAEMISVGPSDACCCNETVCATFKQKTE